MTSLIQESATPARFHVETEPASLISNSKGTVIAVIPLKHEPWSKIQIPALLEALEWLLDHEHDQFNTDLPDALRAYTCRTLQGWKVHTGDGALVATVPHSSTAEAFAQALVRACDSVWSLDDVCWRPDARWWMHHPLHGAKPRVHPEVKVSA
jgi:hypothetical protein